VGLAILLSDVILKIENFLSPQIAIQQQKVFNVFTPV
jgi:hypothetical protein